MRRWQFNSIISMILSSTVQTPQALAHETSGEDTKKNLIASAITPLNQTQKMQVPEDIKRTPPELVGSNQCEAVLTGKVTFNKEVLEGLKQSGVITGSDSHVNHIDIYQGSLLFACDTPIDVDVVHATIHIKPGAIVYIRKTPTATAILNLHDHHQHDVTVRSHNLHWNLAPGREIVFTNKLDHNFDEVNPCPGIWFRSVHETQVSQNLKAFQTMFSTMSSFRILPSVREMAKKKDARGNSIIKTAAAAYRVYKDSQDFRWKLDDSELKPVSYSVIDQTELATFQKWKGNATGSVMGEKLLSLLGEVNSKLSLNPLDSTALYCRGYLFGTIGCTRSAIADLSKAISIEPDAAALYTERGICYTDAQYYDKALKDLDTAIHLNPNSGDAHMARGRLLLWTGKPLQALDDFTKCADGNLEFSPALPGELPANHYNAPQYYLGACYEKLGRNFEAVKHYETALQHKPAATDGYIHRYADQPIDAAERISKLGHGSMLSAPAPFSEAPSLFSSTTPKLIEDSESIIY